jgi:formylglycine-generating enzyme required for sulfatase activity
LSIAVFVSITSLASADTIRGINMEFVTIGNAGNAADTQVMWTDGTTGYGAVGYNYRIGKYEVTNAQWNAFAATAGVPTEDPTINQQPANFVSWYDAAQFCNYLTSGNKSLGAYQLTYASYGSITVDRAAAI